MKADDRCEVCVYYLATESFAPGVWTGVCRRFPPSSQGDIVPTGGGWRATWPHVRETDWCGEFVREEAVQHARRR